MPEKNKWNDRIRYAFDNLFSKGMGASIATLGIASVAVILLAALMVMVFRLYPIEQNQLISIPFAEAFWRSLMRTLDAGTMGQDQGWGYRLVMFVFPTLGGIFIISSLIGIISSGIDQKIIDMRKGHSRVIEQGHTVILGWSEQVFTVIRELIEANIHNENACIVILADRDKVEMEDEIRQRVPVTHNTKIVCRTGNPIEISSLHLAALKTCRAVIVLSPDCGNPDAEVIKVVLAITNRLYRREEPYHIVAEMRDPTNQELSEIIAPGEVEWILVGEFVACMIAQTCRQSGLSIIYTELLDFKGDEIYFFKHPSLDNKSYCNVLGLFEKNSVMGLVDDKGNVLLNPSSGTRIQPEDRLIVIAESKDDVIMDGKLNLQEDRVVNIALPKPKPEKILILGWNWQAPHIIMELDQYVARGTLIEIVSDREEMEKPILSPGQKMRNGQVSFAHGDVTKRRTLEGLNLEQYDHVIILSRLDLEVQEADANTITTLLHLRHLADQRKYHFTSVTQMLDIRNRDLADVARADDFIVSDKMSSLMITQVAETKHLNNVFKALFSPEGSDIYIKPIRYYVKVGQPVNFYTVVESACRKGESALGYRLRSLCQSPEKDYGIVLNPRKSEEVTFSEEDSVIVLSKGCSKRPGK